MHQHATHKQRPNPYHRPTRHHLQRTSLATNSTTTHVRRKQPRTNQRHSPQPDHLPSHTSQYPTHLLSLEQRQRQWSRSPISPSETNQSRSSGPINQKLHKASPQTSSHSPPKIRTHRPQENKRYLATKPNPTNATRTTQSNHHQ